MLGLPRKPSGMTPKTKEENNNKEKAS